MTLLLRTIFRSPSIHDSLRSGIPEGVTPFLRAIRRTGLHSQLQRELRDSMGYDAPPVITLMWAEQISEGEQVMDFNHKLQTLLAKNNILSNPSENH